MNEDYFKHGNLISLAKNNDIKKLLILLKENVHPDVVYWYDKKPALSWAATKGNVECIELLIEAGSDINYPDRYGQTPISWAATEGNAECVELLIEAGSDINYPDRHGKTPLSWAATKGNAECIELLIEAGSDINYPDRHGQTPLSWAATKGNAECIELLIEAGSDINYPDRHGKTPLSWTLRKNNAACAKLLLESRADANKADRTGETPLHVAIRSRSKECIDLVVEKIADNIINKYEFNNTDNVEFDEICLDLIIQRLSALFQAKLLMIESVEEFVNFILKFQEGLSKGLPVKCCEEELNSIKLLDLELQPFLSSMLEDFNATSFTILHEQLQEGRFSSRSILKNVKKQIKFLNDNELLTNEINDDIEILFDIDIAEIIGNKAFLQAQKDLNEKEDVVIYTNQQQSALDRIKANMLAINMQLLDQVLQELVEDKDELDAVYGVFLKQGLKILKSVPMPKFIQDKYDEIYSKSCILVVCYSHQKVMEELIANKELYFFDEGKKVLDESYKDNNLELVGQ